MSTPYIGQLMLVPFNFAPKGFALCNGQLMSIQQNQALFSVLGTVYGGDGRTTFALPNLQGEVAIGQGQSYPIGSTSGSPAVSLNVQQIPAHNHSLTVSTATGGNLGAVLNNTVGVFTPPPSPIRVRRAPPWRQGLSARWALGSPTKIDAPTLCSTG